VIRAIAVAAALAASFVIACINDTYECTQDSDCNIGVAGRCEVDHRCTQYDTTCALTDRRYTKHSGDESQVCYYGRIELMNACAAGQPPADPGDPCGAKVCDELPTCCNAGWSESCVLEAQQVCDLTCDTRIAITASRGSAIELWDLRYDGSNFTATALTDRVTQVDWIAPAPATIEPRLASFGGSDMLVLETGTSSVNVAVDPTREYHDVSSVDLDRDLRDTIALEWQDATGDQEIEVAKLDSMTSRSFDVEVSNRGTWGDYDQDGYPDGVSGTGAHYSFLVNLEDDDHDRILDGSINSSFNGSARSGFISLRGLEWRDIDHDKVLDLAAFGNSIRLHEGGSLLDDTAYLAIDCEPPTTMIAACPDESDANFVGTVVPTATGGLIYAGNTEARTFYRFTPDGTTGNTAITPLTIPSMIGTSGSNTAVAEAVLTRDLDGDHILDVVVVDSSLGLWVSLSTKDPTGTKFVYEHPITPVNPDFSQVHVSVSGAPR
jgi:hypothetical protein